MSIKLALLCIAAALCGHVGQSQAVELIEMTDANQGILLLELSKALASVQRAYTSGFDFNSVGEVKNFLRDCDYVNEVMKQSSEDSFQGFGKQIKAIMAEPSIKAACSARSVDITEGGFEALDTDFEASNYEYLSVKKTDMLAEMTKKVQETPSLAAVLSRFLSKRVDELATASLADAAQHINVFFDNLIKPGMFDFNHMQYKSTCQIDLIKPICKLVRRSNDDEISAVAADLSDFRSMLQSGNKAKLAELEAASGVTMDDLKAKCASMGTSQNRHLKPIDQIESWIAKGLMAREQFEERLAFDGELAFYNELNQLCKLSATQ